jgi:hypothetical protein
MNSHPLPCSNLVSFPRLLMLVIFVIFSLLSLVLIYVSGKCYCWFSPISAIVRTRPWTFNTEQVPFRYFHLMTEAEPVSKRCVVISTNDSLCVLLCFCVYLYWYFDPPCVFWSVSSCITNCHLGYFTWLLVFQCVCWCACALVCVRYLCFPGFNTCEVCSGWVICCHRCLTFFKCLCCVCTQVSGSVVSNWPLCEFWSCVLWFFGIYILFHNFLRHQTMDKAQKYNSFNTNTPSSESYRNY